MGLNGMPERISARGERGASGSPALPSSLAGGMVPAALFGGGDEDDEDECDEGLYEF